MSTNQSQRPKFLEGQYLGADDLTAVVDYHRRYHARHTLGGHTWGIAMGLRLKEVETGAANDQVDVYLEPGYAWDGFGRPVVVLASYKLPVEKFKDQADGLVHVWLRYADSLTQKPQPGFETCAPGDQFARIQESFEVEVGDFRHTQQHGNISGAGELMDALEVFYRRDQQAPLVCDESVPFQTFPDEDPAARWLIPLGLVNWKQGAAGVPGFFQKISEARDLKRSRSLRRFIGVVAEDVFAADGCLRLRPRGTEAPQQGEFSAVALCETKQLKVDQNDKNRDLIVSEQNDQKKLQVVDLVWVEGNLRVQGQTRLFGTRLEFLNSLGEDDDAPLFLRRGQGVNPLNGRDLELSLGSATAASGTNRLAIGTAAVNTESSGKQVYGDLEAKVVVKDDGKVGLGTGAPAVPLHVFAGADAALAADSGYLVLGDPAHDNLVLDKSTIQARAAGAAGPLSLQAEGGELVVHKNKDAATQLVIKNDGKVGIGTASPQGTLDLHGDLKIKGGPPFKIEIFAGITGATPRDTGYAANDWAAVIGGFRISQGNFVVGTGTDFIDCYLDIQGGTWHINVNIKTAVSQENWQVWVLFIRQELVG
jgi:hypothetical protein